MSPKVAMKKKKTAVHPWKAEALNYIKNSGIKNPSKRQAIQIIVDGCLRDAGVKR